jgi:hypothetical protein
MRHTIVAPLKGPPCHQNSRRVGWQIEAMPEGFELLLPGRDAVHQRGRQLAQVPGDLLPNLAVYHAGCSHRVLGCWTPEQAETGSETKAVQSLARGDFVRSMAKGAAFTWHERKAA